MSNPFAAIGKAFKAVVKVVKKIALPALAIGAVVLTGGAALGLLPSVATVLGGLGLSPALTGILVTAAKSATIGAVGSALTGGSIIKGATTGLLVGAAAGGLGAIASRGATAAQAASGASASPAAGDIATTATTATAPVSTGATTFDEAFKPFEMGSPAATGGLGTVAGAAPIAAAPVAAATPAVAGTLAAPVPTSGGFLDSIFGGVSSDPMTRAMMIQGLGQGISAKAAADAQQDAVKEREANYSDTSGLFRLPNTQGQALPDAGTYFNTKIYGNSKLKYDPASGRVVAAGA